MKNIESGSHGPPRCIGVLRFVRSSNTESMVMSNGLLIMKPKCSLWSVLCAKSTTLLLKNMSDDSG